MARTLLPAVVVLAGCGSHHPVETQPIGGHAQGAAWGTAAPYTLVTVPPSGAWAVMCQARADTDGDGKIEAFYEFHGELGGDTMTAFVVDAAGHETPIDNVLAEDPTGRYLAVEIAKAPVLIDTTTWTRTKLVGALPQFTLTGGYHDWSFDPRGRRLLFFRDGAPTVRELATGDELAIAPDAWRADWSVDGDWVVLERLTGDTNGDGFVHGPDLAPHEGMPGTNCGHHFDWGAVVWDLIGDNATDAELQRALDSIEHPDATARSLWRVRDRKTIAGELPLDDAHVIARTDAALAIVPAGGGGGVDLGPPGCNPKLVAPELGAIVFVCPTTGDKGMVRWFRAGKRRDLIETDDMTPLIEGYGTGFVGVYPGQVVADLRTGAEIARGPKIYFAWSDADRVLVDEDDTHGTLYLAGGKHLALSRPDYGYALTAGDYLVFGTTRVDLTTGATHDVPLYPIAVRTDGAVLVDGGVAKTTDPDRAPRIGPLYWVDPAT